MKENNIPERIYKFNSINNDSFAYLIDIIQFSRLYVPLCKDLNYPCEGFFKYHDNQHNPYKSWAEQLDNAHVKNKRILSFTESHKTNSMWAYYAGDHKGVCLEFNTSKLFTDISLLKKVIYTSTVPEIDFSKKNFQDSCLFKSSEWKHEKEWRYISEKDIYFKFNELSLIRILLGPRIDQTKKDIIIDIVKGKKYKPKLFQMSYSTFEYLIVQKELIKT